MDPMDNLTPMCMLLLRIMFIVHVFSLEQKFLFAGNVDGIMVLFRPGFMVGHQVSDVYPISATPVLCYFQFFLDGV